MILSPSQLCWAISVSKPLGEYAFNSKPHISGTVVIEVPEWVALTPHKTGVLIAALGGVAVDVDAMRGIQTAELLGFYSWMLGNDYFASWCTVTECGHHLLAELINIYGLYHPASFEMTVWVAEYFGFKYETLRDRLAGYFQYVVDSGNIMREVVIAGFIDDDRNY